MSIHPPLYLCNIYLIYPSIHLFLHPFIYPSTYSISISPSIALSIDLHYVYLSIYPSTYSISIYPSILLYLHVSHRIFAVLLLDHQKTTQGDNTPSIRLYSSYPPSSSLSAPPSPRSDSHYCIEMSCNSIPVGEQVCLNILHSHFTI